MVKKIQDSTLKDILNEPLAIIGMNCQFPGMDSDIEDINAFYELLVKGQTPIKEVPQDRWNIEEYYDADRKKADKIISRKGGFLNNPHLFDTDFFKISPAEAKQMDPQHRLFLEVSIRALNHANMTLGSLKDTDTGVYCGISSQDYSHLNYKDNIIFNEYTQIGAASSAAAGRLCHFLNLKGPSMAVDTACSSSFSALYLAAMALRNQLCPMAIVGGVHLNLCPENFIGLSKANMLSATGQCSSFDIKADGFVRSEGCGVIIVKRLSDAIKDNNKIHAIIKSIVMNQDGDGTSLVAPNIQAQIAMHEAALEQANLAASDIDYIEAHGTGTIIGDTVEFNAIQYIHQGYHSKDKPLVIGTLKSNLGHTISSSGIASLIKVISALKNETIPPNLHYSTPNSSIDPESIPAVLPVKPTPFSKHSNKKRYVQVSNFGFSGTNVSAVVEEPPNIGLPNIGLYVSNSDNDEPKCFVVSANSEYSLKQMMANYAHYLKESSSSLSDICYTLINCRDHYKFRCAIIARDKKELIKKIESEDYDLKKVVITKDSRTIVNEAHQIDEHYRLGANIRLDIADDHYNKVDLPLYYFDRKSYWHEPRSVHRLDGLSQQPKEQQPIINVLNIEPIAIIGMSCRFPKAANIDEFLSLLEHGESGMADIPLERWDNNQYYDSDVDALGRLYIKQLGLIDNVKNFDAEFFNISPREAKLMSPQLRVFMETSYHAIENANLSLDSIKDSKTGVFVGVGTNEYPRLLVNQGISLDDLNIYFATGNVLSAIPGRVAYTFDLHGPIQAIDTACSSSMTAIHNACLSLQSGDCDMAIAGGVNILLIPDSNITLSKAKMLSPESRCKTFSEDADGYARSEGCGMIVLKRLSTAIKDKDNILAVIKGSSINSDGKRSGFTVPNGVAQEEVIRSALAKSKLSPGDIDYIEAHGTGTPLADPIEVSALTKIFSEHHSKDKPLYISSVKTNIGHCESASGIAGIIKTVLSLQTQKIFKHLNFKKLNPEIELKNTIIPFSTIDWHKEHDLRCAGVSSFGFSGANAHVVLQQAPDRKKDARRLPHESLLILSAKKNASLELLLSSYQKYLSNTDDEFADICYTAATCRSHFLFRVAIKASTAEQAAAIIAQHEYTIYQIKKEKDSAGQTLTMEQLQAAYQDGFMINWSDFYKSLDNKFEKVKLPLYEFVREEHWFDAKDKLKDTPVPKDWCFQLQWGQQPGDINNHKIQGDKWLLIGAKQLASGFIAHGLYIVLENDDYSLDQLDGIIFAAGLEPTSPTDIDSNIDFQKHIIKKLLSLVNELNQRAIKLQLVVLTTNGIAELAVGTLNMSNSSLIGFCKTLVLELPQYQTILIDADKTESGTYFAQVVEEIKHNHGSCYEHIIAYREDKRLVARLKKINLIDKKKSLDGKGRYLITGGCGGLGLVTAQALLSAGARELILTSRHVDKPALKAAIKKIQANYPGRIIQTISLDVSDKEKLRSLLLDINRDGLLKGIIHAAGAAIKAPLTEHKDEDVDYLFSAKVKGGWYLHELSQYCALDFFVVYSSVASVFGSNKESVYSATNSFLDALIAHRQRLGLVGTAIQWGPWGDAGMAIKRSRDQGLKQALINDEQGHALIKVLISGQLNHATIISPAYLEFMLDFVPKPWPAFHQYLADNLKVVDPSINKNLSPWLSDYLEISEDKRFKACKDMLSAICKEILELVQTDDLDEDEGFFEIGFDSLMIVEMASELKTKLEPSLKVTVTIGFDYPSINKLSKYIESELNNNLTSKQVPQSLAKLDDDSIAIIGMSCSFPDAPELPNYAFERSEFWLEKKSENIAHRDEIHPLLGQMLSMPGNEYLFSHKLDLEHLSYIKQYTVFEQVTFPATAYIESGLAAAKAIFKHSAFRMEQFTIARPLYPKQGQEFQLQVKPTNDQRYKINIFAKLDDNWQLFSEMELQAIAASAPESVDLVALKSFFGDKVDLSQIYEHFKKRSLFYGDEFKVLQEGYVKSDSVLAKVALTKTSHGLGYYYHPIVLDGAMQSILLLGMNHVENTTYVPYALTRMTTFQEAPRSIWVHLTKRNADNKNDLCVDIKLYDNSGLLIGDIEGLKLRIVTRSHFISYESILQHLYHTQWNPLNHNVLTQVNVPDLLVISNDTIKAKRVLGALNYQLVEDPRTLVDIENKNIVFLYEQGQFNDLFHYCQKMFKVAPNSFILVTENAYAINDKDEVNPYHTMASSFWKSFSNELNLNKNYTVDLDSQSDLIEVLKYIFGANSTENQFAENQFAVRDSLYIPRLKKKQLLINHAQPEILFHSNANYLIIGGTGGLAKPLIEYLIRRGVKHIMITSRSECPMDTKALIESAKQKQVCIKHYKADASNYQQMEELIANIDQNSEPLKGVFHLAGLIRDGLIVNLKDEDIQSVLSAKMDSALILHQLTKTIQLDLFVLFSSSASLLGARGQSNYVAANGFLDGLAHLRKQQSLPAITINWGPFTLGMTANFGPALQQHGFIPLDKGGIDIIDVLLKSQLTQISPCPIHWDTYFKHAPKQRWLSDLVKSTVLPDQYFLNSLRQHTKEECVAIEEIALCDFQYIFWVLNKLDYSFNIGMQLQLHGKLNKDYICQAFDVVIKQNSAFWIKFNEDAPIQIVQKQGRFKLIYNDISLSNETNRLNQEFHNNIMRIIPLTEQPLIRIYLYKINNDLHELHIVIPHIIVDDTSCEIVFSQFKNSYETLTLGKRLIQIPEKESYFNYVKHNNHHYEKNLQEKINFWQAYNKDFKPLSFGYEYRLTDAANPLKHLFHYPIAPQLVEQFIEWHKAQNINVSTGLVAACQIVFHKISRQKKIPIILIHSGREGSQYKPIVGLFSEYKRINITLKEEYKFIDCIKSIDEQLLKTAPYQPCSHLIKSKGFKGSRKSITQYVTLAFNKIFLKRSFKESKLNSTIIDYYLEYLSRIVSITKNRSIKHKINKLFKLNMPLQESDGLRVLINITPSFFSKEVQNSRFADLDYTFPSHLSCMDRPISNQTLWVYFSKNQHGEYQLSINGPLTTDCKDQIAIDFNKIITNVVKNGEHNIADLFHSRSLGT